MISNGCGYAALLSDHWVLAACRASGKGFSRLAGNSPEIPRVAKTDNPDKLNARGFIPKRFGNRDPRFGRAKAQAIAGNDGLGIPNYGSEGSKIVVRYR